jgi:hypothetical protein
MQHTSSPQNELLKRNERVWLRPGRIYIPAWQFSGLDYTATDITSMGTGTPSATELQIQEVNTSSITGLGMTANATSVGHFLALPGDIDISHPIYFSVVWTANNTSGSVTWDVLHKVFKKDTTVLGTAEATVVLSKAIGAKTMAGVAYTLMVTDEGRLNGGTLADTTEYLQLAVVRTTATTITECFLIGLNIRYTPKMFQYGSMKQEAKAATYIASEKFAN